MKYKYSVGEKDFLNFQLYQISNSKAFSSKLRRQQVVVAIINLGLGVYFYADKKLFLAVAFFLVGALSYVLYPRRIKRSYKKRFEEEIKQKFQEHFNVPATLEILDNTIKTSDKRGVSEKNYMDIKEICHIEDGTFVLFNSNQAFILSKELTENYPEMVKELNQKASQFSILVTNDLEWEF